MRALASILLFSAALWALTSADACLGEFQVCGGGDCVLDASLCGKCSSGQYLCPDGVSCVNGAEGYTQCPNIKGTHFDWTLPIETRLDYLVQQATVTEKIAQLTNDAPAIVRLGIPSYNWLNDDEHGVMGTHSTVFPNGCSLGATWSKQSLKAVGTAVGTEARGLHNGFVHSGNRGHNINGAGITMYAPNMNTVRDPRWGRAQEVYGEDPYLSSQLTIGFVVGGQGNNASNDYQVAAACCKHFVAYDLESLPTLRYVFDAQVNSRNMWETFLPVFKACVVQAQGAHVMCSYNAVNGVPTCAEPRLLNGVLRSQWGWDGFVVSDYDAWAMIYSTHGYCQNYTCAAAAGINAGMDQEGGGTIAIEKMQDAINQGLVNTSSVDEAFRRLFRARIRLGMLDPPTLVPWNYLSNDTTVVEGPTNIALARQVAREGMCLYKNQNNVLPLNPTTINKLAIVGFQATQEGLLMGNYAEYPDAGIPSVLTAMVDALGQDKTAACTFEQDIDYYVAGQTGIYVFDAQACCDLCSSVSTCHYFTYYSGECYLKSNNSGRVSSPGRVSGSCNSNGKIAWQPGCYDVTCADQSGFAAAQQIAQGADATIVLLGLDQSVESEGNDRADITLSDGQQKLVSALRTAIPNKPLIAVLIHGGTLGFNGVDEQVDAILDAWYPGMQGANAIADVIFGLYNPAGRTPVTYYKSNSDLPAPGMMDLYPNNASSGLTYRYFKGQPLFPFGFGLSYTTFSYANLQTDFETYSACQNMIVSVDVTNTGSVDGDEVVQLYLQQPQATVPVPTIRLAAFDRVHIAAGQTRTVTLIVEPESHSVVYDGFDVYDSSAVAVEAGDIDLFVGGGQPQFYQGHVSTTVRVVNTRPLNDC